MLSLTFCIIADVLVSVRFAPPLVIMEEDLAKAVTVIGECLVELDEVLLTVSFSGLCDLTIRFPPPPQVDVIPGDDEEKGHTDTLTL